MRSLNSRQATILVVLLTFLMAVPAVWSEEKYITGWGDSYNPNTCHVQIKEGQKTLPVQPVPGVQLTGDQRIESSCSEAVKTGTTTVVSDLLTDASAFFNSVKNLFTKLLKSHPGALVSTGTPMGNDREQQCIPQWEYGKNKAIQKVVKPPRGPNHVYFGLSEDCNGKPIKVEIFRGNAVNQWNSSLSIFEGDKIPWKPVNWGVNESYKLKDVELDLDFAKAKYYKVKMTWSDNKQMEVILEGVSASDEPSPLKNGQEKRATQFPPHFLAAWLIEKGDQQWVLEAYQKVVNQKEPAAWLMRAWITHPTPIK